MGNKLWFFKPQTAEGRKLVNLPLNALEEGRKQWERSLVGCFVGEASVMKLLVPAIDKLWAMKSKVTTSKKGEWHVFHFENLWLLN